MAKCVKYGFAIVVFGIACNPAGIESSSLPCSMFGSVLLECQVAEMSTANSRHSVA